MKSLQSLLVWVSLLSPVLAHAEGSVLVLDLTAREFHDRGGWKDVKLNTLNSKLERAGLPKFASSVALLKTDGPKYKVILEQLKRANEVLGRKLELPENGYFVDFPKLCYSGEVASVNETVEGLRGSLFHEDMGLQGYRYQAKKTLTWPTQFNNRDVQATYRAESPGALKAWKDYDVRSDAVLFLSDFGPEGDGTELYATLVPRCGT